MKKILIIIPSIKKGGGAENVAVSIGSELNKKGYEVHFFTFFDDLDKIEIKGKYYSIKENISKNNFIKFIKLFTRAYKISQYSKKYKIDISISHLDEANFSNIISKYFPNNKHKIIIELHNSIEKSLSKLYIFLYKILINKSDKVVSLTQEDLLNYKKYFNINHNKLINIYNPVNLEKINFLNKEKTKDFKIDNNIFTFINIGRLSYQKNQELLISAFLKFNKKFKNSRLLILGEGELKDYLKEKVNKSKNKNIVFLGKKNNPYKYLKKSDYLLMTSNYEGLPVVQIESLACNTPIITTDCKTGPREIINFDNINYNRGDYIEIGDCGILTPTGNENNLIQAMEIAYKNINNVKLKFIKNSSKQIYQFDIKNIIKKWEKIIEE